MTGAPDSPAQKERASAFDWKGEATTPVPEPLVDRPGEGRTILVFGATGQQGGAVARALRAHGWLVRALVRDPASARAEALARLGVELAPGDLSDTASIREAISGAYGVFSVQPNSGQDPRAGLSDEEEVRYANTIADLAVEQGVKHFVYASTLLLSKGPTGVANLDCKLEIEAHLRSLALRSTVVRPGTFMELLLRPGVAPEQDVFTFLVPPDQPAQLIAVDDIGRIVAGVFGDPERYGGQALNIAGDAPTGRDMAEALGGASGRPVQYQRYSDAVLAENPVLARTVRAFEPGRSEEVDIGALNRTFGKLFTLEAWLAGPGGGLLPAARHENGAVQDECSRASRASAARGQGSA